MTGRHRAAREPIAKAPLAILGVAVFPAVMAAATWHPKREAPVVEVVSTPVTQTVWHPAPVVRAVAYVAPQRIPPITGAKGLVPNAVALAHYIQRTYPDVVSIGGVRPCDYYAEHCRGIALDIMVGTNTDLGDRINADLLAQADRFGIRFTLWRETYRNPAGAKRWMSDRGSVTANHGNHIHAQVAA